MPHPADRHPSLRTWTRQVGALRVTGDAGTRRRLPRFWCWFKTVEAASHRVEHVPLYRALTSARYMRYKTAPPGGTRMCTVTITGIRGLDEQNGSPTVLEVPGTAVDCENVCVRVRRPSEQPPVETAELQVEVGEDGGWVARFESGNGDFQERAFVCGDDNRGIVDAHCCDEPGCAADLHFDSLQCGMCPEIAPLDVTVADVVQRRRHANGDGQHRGDAAGGRYRRRADRRRGRRRPAGAGIDRARRGHRVAVPHTGRPRGTRESSSCPRAARRRQACRSRYRHASCARW